MMERRRSGRRPFDQQLGFEVGTVGSDGYANVTCEAQGLDIGSEGMGLLCDYPLAKGMVLHLLFPAHEIDTTLPVFAEVVWSAPVDDRFRAGLRFLSFGDRLRNLETRD